MIYSQIIIPGRILILKNSPVLHCKSGGRKPCGKYPGIIPNDSIKSEKEFIIMTMRRAWGRPPIQTPVNVAFRFYLPHFFPGQATDLSNSYQLYEDLLQEPVWKNSKTKGFHCSKGGSGVITNDKLIHGHDGSGFYFLCDDCTQTKKGKRLCPMPPKVWDNKEKKMKQPQRATVCPSQRIEIEITDLGRREIPQKKLTEIFGK
jgi:hypothetical protein